MSDGGMQAVLRGQTRIDFPRLWVKGLALSAVLVVASIGLLVGRGLEFGIDFEGGISWEVPAPGVGTDEARDALGEFGLGSAKIQIVGDDLLRVQAGTEARDDEAAVSAALAALAGTQPAEVSVTTVGPSWGDEITASAVRALVLFFVAILAYLSLRLEWRMAVATIVAVAHDIVVSVGFYAATGLEVTPATVISFLTILGYSIYDTIVVFDKVRENEARPAVSAKLTPTELVSLSMNQVLLRSINTTVSSLIPVVSLLVVGATVLGVTTLREFALALAVGMAVGAYSSIFVAAPIVARLKERDPRARARRERAARSADSPRRTRPVPAGASADATPEATGDATAGPATAAESRRDVDGPQIQARPSRKKRRT